MSGLNPVLTIGEQVAETLRAHEDVRWREARHRAAELLGTVGIPRPGDQLKRYPHQFSGGMRQRVLIAIALALRPTLLIADEPTTALDVTVQAQVLELLHQLTVERGTAILLISHDLGIMARMTQRIMVMYAGHGRVGADRGDLSPAPRHPYTVGLLRSIPRVRRRGAPADTHRRLTTRLSTGSRVAAPSPLGAPGRSASAGGKCRRSRLRSGQLVSGGPLRGRLLACYNPVAADEVEGGKPLRPGFQPARRPRMGSSLGRPRDRTPYVGERTRASRAARPLRLLSDHAGHGVSPDGRTGACGGRPLTQAWERRDGGLVGESGRRQDRRWDEPSWGYFPRHPGQILFRRSAARVGRVLPRDRRRTIPAPDGLPESGQVTRPEMAGGARASPSRCA